MSAKSSGRRRPDSLLGIERGRHCHSAYLQAVFGDSKASCRGETDFGIYSTTFLEQAFRTDAYRITLTFHDDGSWGYRTATELKLEGQNMPFPH
ncbi:hypothetical protein [Sphingomonas pokkalii]|uniref:Uncharacterized protein n=1 Tax=Sphingomonas pokkalii TaxID=2175090 RepID=A0A2U0SAD1_9SPHN|nr:hypothetical protein [Sphingomonas pokkalii]PVX28347.1 hypothetical protein DD559_02505 [Sphingomonas pokkalii]